MMIAIAPGAAAQTAVSVDVDPATGLKSWQWQGNGLDIELVQVPPDFIRASYAARGLPEAVREAVASRCVFGTIVRNLAESPLQYRVADWHYVDSSGARHPIKTKSEWLAEWHGMGVRFSWSILADDVTFSKGDWIQGFTVLNVPHGSPVSLKIVWFTDGKRHEKILPDMECAPAPE